MVIWGMVYDIVLPTLQYIYVYIHKQQRFRKNQQLGAHL